MQWFNKWFAASVVAVMLFAPAAWASSVTNEPVRFSLGGTIDTPGTGVDLSNISLGDKYHLTFDVVPTAPRQVSGDVVTYQSFNEADASFTHHPVIADVSLRTESGFHFSHDFGTSGPPYAHESWAIYDRTSGALEFHTRDDQGTGFDLALYTDASFPDDWFWDVSQPLPENRIDFAALSGELHFNFWLDGSIGTGGELETGGPVDSRISTHAVPTPSAAGLGVLSFAMLLLPRRPRRCRE